MKYCCEPVKETSDGFCGLYVYQNNDKCLVHHIKDIETCLASVKTDLEWIAWKFQYAPTMRLEANKALVKIAKLIKGKK